MNCATVLSTFSFACLHSLPQLHFLRICWFCFFSIHYPWFCCRSWWKPGVLAVPPSIFYHRFRQVLIHCNPSPFNNVLLLAVMSYRLLILPQSSNVPTAVDFGAWKVCSVQCQQVCTMKYILPGCAQRQLLNLVSCQQLTPTCESKPE